MITEHKYEIINTDEFNVDYSSKTFYKAFIFSVFSFIVLFIILYITSSIYYPVNLFYIIITSLLIQIEGYKFIWFFIRKRMPDWKVETDTSGIVSLSKNSIRINEQIINLKEVKHLTIHNGEYRIQKYSDLMFFMFINWHLLEEIQNNGITKFDIIFHNGETTEVKFIVKGEFNYIRIKNLLRLWYLSGIDIDEMFYKNNGGKTFLFEGYNDKKIAELKNNYIKENTLPNNS